MLEQDIELIEIVQLDYIQLFACMISTLFARGVGRSLLRAPRFAMNHIKNMHEENIRVKVEENQNGSILETNDRVYKPTYTIEFDRVGEVLLYSANPVQKETLYFKYPYILYESFFPLAILNYVLNPLDMVWFWPSFGLYGSIFLFCPRVWYWGMLKYTPMRISLLRGGRVVKVESQNAGAEKYSYWIETRLIRPLTEDKLRFDDRDNAEFLTTEGQLKYDLDVEVEEFKFFGVNTNMQHLHFKNYGTVHHPELFEAVVKGYNIDTTDFVINTADNIRYREPNYNV